MILIYTLVFTIILSALFALNIKMKYRLYYLVSALIGTITTVYEISRTTSSVKLYGTILYLEKLSIVGYSLIAFFFLVMLAGVVNPKWLIIKKVQIVRAKLAILASVFIIPHSIIYLVNLILLKLPIDCTDFHTYFTF